MVMDPIVSHFEIFACTKSVGCGCEGSPIAIIYIRNVCKSIYTIIMNFKLKDLPIFLLPLINPSSCCRFHSLTLDARYAAQ